MTIYGRDDADKTLAPDPHAEEARQTDQMESLRRVVVDAMAEARRITDEQKGVRTWLTAVGAAVALVFLVALGGIIFGITVYNDQSQDDELIAQLQRRQGTTDVVLHDNCALYGAFYDFYSPAARAVYPQGPGAYDASFLRLQRSADHANCGLPHTVPGT